MNLQRGGLRGFSERKLEIIIDSIFVPTGIHPARMRTKNRRFGNRCWPVNDRERILHAKRSNASSYAKKSGQASRAWSYQCNRPKDFIVRTDRVEVETLPAADLLGRALGNGKSGGTGGSALPKELFSPSRPRTRPTPIILRVGLRPLVSWRRYAAIPA